MIEGCDPPRLASRFALPRSMSAFGTWARDGGSLHRDGQLAGFRQQFVVDTPCCAHLRPSADLASDVAAADARRRVDGRRWLAHRRAVPGPANGPTPGGSGTSATRAVAAPPAAASRLWRCRRAYPAAPNPASRPRRNGCRSSGRMLGASLPPRCPTALPPAGSHAESAAHRAASGPCAGSAHTRDSTLPTPGRSGRYRARSCAGSGLPAPATPDRRHSVFRTAVQVPVVAGLDPRDEHVTLTRLRSALLGREEFSQPPRGRPRGHHPLA